MLDLTIQSAKESFFDKEAVVRAFGTKIANAFSRFGAHVMTKVRGSIRKADTPSKPGRPPHSHGQHLLKNNIFFAADLARGALVIGPVRLGNKSGRVPGVLERGGNADSNKRPRPAYRRGQWGPLKTARRSGTETRMVRDIRGKKRHVVFGPLWHNSEIDEANRLAAELYGSGAGGQQIAARPYMAPAFAAELSKIGKHIGASQMASTSSSGPVLAAEM